jgi:hypothetical protein
MECSRCGSQNMKTFEMAHASYNIGISSWGRFVKLMIFGPLGLFIRPKRNSVVNTTSPPEKPFPVFVILFSFLFLSTLLWLLSIYLRKGSDYGETQMALLVNAIMFVIFAAIVSWDLVRCTKARKKYPERLDKWTHSWICLQCGTTSEVRDLPRA